MMKANISINLENVKVGKEHMNKKQIPWEVLQRINKHDLILLTSFYIKGNHGKLTELVKI